MEKKKGLLSRIALTEEDTKTFAEMGITLEDSVSIDASAGVVLVDNAIFNNDYYTKADIEELEQNYDQLEQEYAELKKNSSTKGAMEDVYKGQVKEFQEKVKKLQEEIEGLRGQVTTLQGEKESLEKTVKELQGREPEIHTVEKTVEVIKKEIPADYEELQKAGKTLSQTVEKLGAVEKELEETKGYLETAEKARDKALEELKKIRTQSLSPSPSSTETSQPEQEHTDSEYKELEEAFEDYKVKYVYTEDDLNNAVIQTEEKVKKAESSKPKVQKMNRVQVSKADSLLVEDKDEKIRKLELRIKQLETKEKTGTVESGNTKHTAKWESVGAKKMYLAMTKLPITKQNMEFLDTNYQFQLLLKELQQMKR